MSCLIEQADIVKWANTYDGPPFHAALMDPPYHLTSITKRFGKAGSAPAQEGTDGAFRRMGAGFMGKLWDGGDIAFRPETWAALAQHLHPGAFGMAFAGSRGWHRMAVAIEDAGLIIHPTIGFRGWVYGSGFTKATRLDVALDRQAGAERIVVGQKKHAPKFAAADFGYREKDNGYNSRERESFDLTVPATHLAAAWAGHRYGLQALKPAIEPIIVFQKPYAGRSIDSMVATGAGALWIEGGRIAGEGNKTFTQRMPGNRRRDEYRTGTATGAVPSDLGRWPANFALCHHPLCADDCHSDCAVVALGAQSGKRPAGNPVRGTEPSQVATNVYRARSRVPSATHDDNGTAARYFFCADWMLDRLEAEDPVGYYAKASPAEREAGLDPLQVKLMRDLYGDDDLPDFKEVTVDDGRQTPIDNAYLRGKTERRNSHPTIKPLSLTRWLATLLLPPALYAPRRLLVPFAGTGSEMIGGLLAGWEDLHGIELEADHVAIAQARLRYWEQRKAEFAQGQPIKVRGRRKASRNQQEMF